uniref:RIMS-binding protein 1/2/3 Fn3 domain-containing protein n=1 Tax=Knipowitschia caucasica TaxID=637954 RepID=A0AAV2MIF3_KNICA
MPNIGAVKPATQTSRPTVDSHGKELKSSKQNNTTIANISTTADHDASNSPESSPEGPSRSTSFNAISQTEGPVSPPPTSTFAKKSPSCAEKARTPTRIKQAPAEVRSMEVIKTVGVSGLMIGWERPPLDELGCSNGTFVYGYRVLVDGVFHKSVMSSACTKCILENVNLSVPIQISQNLTPFSAIYSCSSLWDFITSIKNKCDTVTPQGLAFFKGIRT